MDHKQWEENEDLWAHPIAFELIFPILHTCQHSLAIETCAKLWTDCIITIRFKWMEFSKDFNNELIKTLWNGCPVLDITVSQCTRVLVYHMGWVGLWGFLWWAPSAKRKYHHGVSSGWSSVWHHWSTDLSSTRYEQILIILGVWPFWLTPFFFQSITFWLTYYCSIELCFSVRV